VTRRVAPLVAACDLAQAGLGHGELEVRTFVDQDDVGKCGDLVRQARDIHVSWSGSNSSFPQSVSP
jgi:hypothetical protein